MCKVVVINPHSSYSKLEDVQPGSNQLLQFDFLLVSSGDYHFYQGSHDLVARAEGFANLVLSFSQFPPFRIILEDKVLVLARKST